MRSDHARRIAVLIFFDARQFFTATTAVGGDLDRPPDVPGCWCCVDGTARVVIGTSPGAPKTQQANLLCMQTQPIDAVAPAEQRAVARLFSVLADPTRVALVELLLERPRTVRELVNATCVPRGRVSNHLACLRWCGFATSERSGRDVVYRIADRRIRRVLAQGRQLADERAEHLASCQRIGPDWI